MYEENIWFYITYYGQSPMKLNLLVLSIKHLAYIHSLYIITSNIDTFKHRRRTLRVFAQEN